MDVQAFLTSQSMIRARESTENVPANRRVREVGEKVAYLDPDAAPFTLMLQKAATKRTGNTKFEWIEQELQPRWDQVNGAHLVGDTDIAVDNGAYFSVGDIINNVRTGEKSRVSDVNGNTLTVVRGVGSTAAAAINDNDDIQIIGNAYAEGSPLGLEKSNVEAYLYNYTQIFRTPVGVTGSQDESENYTGKDRDRLRGQALLHHKIDMERSLLFGERNIDTTSTNNPRRYAGGALYFLTANGNDQGATALTFAESEDWFQDLFMHTAEGDSRTLFASPRLITVIDQFAPGQLYLVPSDKTYGISVKQLLTSHGTLNIVKHRLLEDGPGGTGYGKYGIAASPRQWKMRVLGKRNTKLRPDVGTKGDDGWTDEYLTEAGWQVGLIKTQGVINNFT